MNKTEQLAAITVVMLDSALAHLQRANVQTSIEDARPNIAQAVVAIRKLTELACAALPNLPETPLH